MSKIVKCSHYNDDDYGGVDERCEEDYGDEIDDDDVEEDDESDDDDDNNDDLTAHSAT